MRLQSHTARIIALTFLLCLLSDLRDVPGRKLLEIRLLTFKHSAVSSPLAELLAYKLGPQQICYIFLCVVFFLKVKFVYNEMYKS